MTSSFRIPDNERAQRVKAREILYQWNIILRHSGKCVLNLQFVICNRKPGQKGRMNLSSATHIKPFGLHMTCVILVNTWTFIISPTDWWTHPVKHLASRETFYVLCCVAWATIFVLVKKCPVIIIATWADEHQNRGKRRLAIHLLRCQKHDFKQMELVLATCAYFQKRRYYISN